MTNINRIAIIYINLSDDGYLPSLTLFDYHLFFDIDKFVAVSIDNSNLRFELEQCGSYKIYDLLSFSDLNFDIISKSKILTYVGLSLSEDKILDLIIGDTKDSDRLFYLKSVLYYKVAQHGKIINKFNLNIKHFDDFINQYQEDIVEYDVKSNNEDFSESNVMIKTYLNESEINERFINYII